MLRHTLIRSARGMAAAVLLSASSNGAIAGAQSVPPSPPVAAPGRLVDIGGWRLHINCTGERVQSQPTVVLEAGIGDFSVEWSLVQPGVSRFARVCSYDRAGDGWSDLGPHPRTMRQIVWELHTLLEKAGERSPFVLVGHSYGGPLVRLYASTYPSETAGMVLVDAGSDNPVRWLNGKLVRLVETATGRAMPDVKRTNPLREVDIPAPARSQIEAAARQSSPHANDPPRDKLPPDARRMRSWALAQVKHYASGDNPFENEELALMLAERTKRDYSLGDIPLIVLTRGIGEGTGPDGRELEAEHAQDQTAMTTLSRAGRLVIATKSGHHIQLDEPELVVKSIGDVVSAVTK